MTDLVHKGKVVKENPVGSLAESFLQARNLGAESNLGPKPQESFSQAVLEALEQARKGLAELSGHNMGVQYKPFGLDLNISQREPTHKQTRPDHPNKAHDFRNLLQFSETVTYKNLNNSNAA